MKRSTIVKGWAVLLAMTLLTGSAMAEATQAEAQEARIELSTQYPSMVVKAGDSLTFDLDIDNRSGRSQDVALSIEASTSRWTSRRTRRTANTR